MKSSSAQAILGAVAAVVLAVAITGLGGWPLTLAILSTAATAALTGVAFATQSRRLRDDERLVYRPVYARRQAVQRRVRSDD